MTVAEVEVLVGANVKPLTDGMKKAGEAVKTGAKNMAEGLKSVDGPVAALKKRVEGMATGAAKGMQSAATSMRSTFGIASKEVVAEADKMADGVERSMKRVGNSVDDPGKKLKATAQTLQNFGENANRVGIGLTASLTAPLLLAGKTGLSAAGDFQQTMAVFRVTSAATAAEMARVGKAAKDLGADVTLPGTSATDAAGAMLELSKAGLSVKDTLGAAHGVLQMSAAAQIDNATAAKIAAEALTSFGLAGSKAGMVSDLLASAANASTASMTEIADGLSQSSAVYAKAGISIQDLTTGLSMLANAGIKGSDAGTSMKTMLMAIQNPTKEAAEQMNTLGVKVYDAKGRMNDFRAIIGQFEVATKNLTAKQRDHALATIFGSDAVRAASVIVGNGVAKYDALEKAVTKQGVAAKTAGAYNEGYKGALDGATSAGQTMLQGFIEPTLPALTDLFKRGSAALDSMDKWSPTAKKAAVGLGVLVAVTGPAILAIGGLASGISAVISLKALFVPAEAAKAAALVTTTAATEAATVASVSEASATEGLTLSAWAAEPALNAEAAALGNVAASADVAAGAARGATVAMVALKGAIGVAMAAYAGWQAGTAAHEGMDRAAKNAGYDNSGDFLHKRLPKGMLNLAAGLSPVGMAANLWNGGTGDVGGGPSDADMARPNAGAVRKWKAAAGQRATANAGRSAANAVANAIGVTAHGDAVTRAQEAADRESAAAKARMDALDAKGGGGGRHRGGGHGGGGGSRTPKETAAEKAEKIAIREEKQEYASLTDKLYEANKAKALLGKTSEALSLQYDLHHGKIIAVNGARAQEVIKTLYSKEALEAHTEATKKAKEAADQFAKDRQQHFANIALAEGGLSKEDEKALSMFGKRYAAISDEANRKRVLWAIDEDAAAAAKERFDAGQSYAKDTIDGLQREIALRSVVTRLEQARFDIAERRLRGETVTKGQQKDIEDAARNIDDEEARAKRAEAAAKKTGDAWAAMAAKVAKAKDEGRDATERYDAAMAEINERLVLSGAESAKARDRTIRLAESFGVGATAADRIRSGMARANVVMMQTLRVDRVEAFKERMKDMATSVSGYFAKTATDILSGMTLSFGGITRGFGAMLADMARQQIAGQIQKGAMSWITGLLGAAGGGSGVTATKLGSVPWASLTPHATGGPVLKNEAILVGEQGPEMFVPSGNGSIATARQTKTAMGGARPINVTIHVAAPNPGAFHESAPQMARKAGQEIRAALGSLG